MSEVYIRSQNKEKLYRLGGNYACVEYGEYEDVKKKRGGAEADKKRHVICISDGCLEEIGEYATKERCLEVLDEIQKACVSYLFTAGGAAVIRGGMDVQPFAAVIPRLYEMPEKSWTDEASQLGAFTSLENAKSACKAGYTVYDDNGKAVYTAAGQQTSAGVPFSVQVDILDLNIRTGAGTNYAKTGETTGKGVFTIVEVKAGQGASAGWGRLKSGAGWISLDYATRLA